MCGLHGNVGVANRACLTTSTLHVDHSNVCTYRVVAHGALMVAAAESFFPRNLLPTRIVPPMPASTPTAATRALTVEERLERVLEQNRGLREEQRQLRLEARRMELYTECLNADSDLLRAMLDAPEDEVEAPPRAQRFLHARRPRPVPVAEDTAVTVGEGGQRLGWQERVRAAASRARSVRRGERSTQMQTRSKTAQPQATPAAVADSTTLRPCEYLLRTKRKPALRALAASLSLPVNKATPVAELRERIAECFGEIEAGLQTPRRGLNPALHAAPEDMD